MKINELTKAVHENAVNHGWWQEERSFGDLIALCHSELSEALEEYRKGHSPTEIYKYCSKCGLDEYQESPCMNCSIANKPEGILSELADVVIRIMDMCGHYGIDLEAALIEKHEFNKTRPYRHGNKVI